MASAMTSTLKGASHEPLVTGTLLYLLTRGPLLLREQILRPLRTNLLAKNGPVRLAALITVLKVLTSVGVLRRINGALNSLAWNNWKVFGRPGAPFAFGPGNEELITITGGSSGFGYEMVKSFSKHARIVVLDISAFPPELARLPGVHFYRCDVTDTPAVEDVCEEIRQTHSEATVLINNAGIGIGKTVLDTSNAESEKLFKNNLISHFVLIREFLPGMLQKKRGHIVTIASMAFFVAAPGLLDYCCSKVGALYVSEGIRTECLSRYPGGEGICTTSIHPSWHKTGILKGSETTLAKYGIIPDPPSNVSDLVVKQVLNGKSGRLCVPKVEEGKMGLRNWPMWMQDIMYGHVWQRKDQFSFAKSEGIL